MTDDERAALVERAMYAYMDFHSYDEVLDPKKERDAFRFVIAAIERDFVNQADRAEAEVARLRGLLQEASNLLGNFTAYDHLTERIDAALATENKP